MDIDIIKKTEDGQQGFGGKTCPKLLSLADFPLPFTPVEDLKL